jgi:hypothetical protein
MGRRGRAAPASLAEHDLEQLLVLGAAHRRGVRRVGWNVEVLPRHEAGSDERSIERTRDPIAQEHHAVRLDASASDLRTHARTLAAVAPPIGRTKLASETATLKVGDAAPPFELRSHDGRDVALDALRGQKIVIAFFAFAFTNT